ncbi:PREDICTED: beta-fructofuranosidase, insoluble isoenzyme CWINV1-like [Tarenaya hassleriana]|uniref:beta-fructofuranosidase, insoluble isoenzyme CWINV1-like n=1 Tax=Tarenaya hassleriana TaxID=28532 RepID=UPI00053C4985|nr:PREDICTED: beta-fructofuranosidase, insoluble isoenzyme CWINV1-like [Tarenaya hassleriana]
MDIGFLMFLWMLFGNYVVHLDASMHVHALNQPYRTGYHFQPPKNWMNDPNGPMLYKGIYHLFYQWNPNGAVWGNIVWGHSTSTDLVNWVRHPPAISPSQPSDINGCWAGSATILPGGKPVVFYTGMDHMNRQVQNLAVPKNLSDPFLREWSKSPENPLLAPTADNGIDPDNFRDPTTAWLGHDGHWRVIIGSKMDRGRGLAILYKSKDFINWVKSPEPLHSDDGTGVWECPDFFPVARSGSTGIDTSSFGTAPRVKHVLKISVAELAHDCYTVGTYDRTRDVYVPDKGFVRNRSAPRFDYGKFYASKTFFDAATRRRILWGWVNESSPEKDDIEKGWSGLQAIPRKIWLGGSGKQLIQWPIMEIEKLRAKQVKWRNKVLMEKGSILEVHGITASQADVEVSFEARDLEKADPIEPGWTDAQLICSQENESVKTGLGPFGLMVLASKNLEEYTSVYFRIFKARNDSDGYVVVMCSDQSRSSLNKNNDRTTYGAFVDINPSYQPISLRTLIDHSIVESYGGRGKACITSRVYPKMAIGESSHLYVFNRGSQSVRLSTLSAWNMKTAHINI